MKRSILFTCLISTFFISSSIAQSFFEKLGSEINFDLKSPKSELRDNGLTDFYGLSLAAFYVGCNDKKIKFTPGYRVSAGITSFLDGDQVILADPEGAVATERLFNAHFSFELVGRFIYNSGKRVRPYAEVYAGPRVIAAYNNLALNQRLEGYNNTTDMVFSNVSTVSGLGIGTLIQLSESIDLNMKYGIEYSGQLDHSELNKDNFVGGNRVTTNKAFNNNFSIGITVRPRCGRARKSNDCRRSSSRSYYNNCSAPRGSKSISRGTIKS
jgi:hypothetical protein